MLDGADGELGSPTRYFVAFKMYAAQSAGTDQSQPVNNVGQIYTLYISGYVIVDASLNLHYRRINLTFKKFNRRQYAPVFAVQRVYTLDRHEFTSGFTRDEHSGGWRLQPYVWPRASFQGA